MMLGKMAETANPPTGKRCRRTERRRERGAEKRTAIVATNPSYDG